MVRKIYSSSKIRRISSRPTSHVSAKTDLSLPNFRVIIEWRQWWAMVANDWFEETRCVAVCMTVRKCWQNRWQS
jgi:hypothetical protein